VTKDLNTSSLIESNNYGVEGQGVGEKTGAPVAAAAWKCS